MDMAKLWLYEIDKLATKLSSDFGSLSYDRFVEGRSTIGSAILGLLS